MVWCDTIITIIYLFVLLFTFDDLFLACGWFDVGSSYMDFLDDDESVDLKKKKKERGRRRR